MPLKQKKKRGRPLKDAESFRGCRLHVKLTAPERILAESSASICCVRLSDFVREALRREVDRVCKKAKKQLGHIFDQSA